VQDRQRLLDELLGGYWLSEEKTRELVHAHAQVYRQAPEVKALITLGFLVPHPVDSQPGFLLSFLQVDDSWRSLGPAIAARVWIELSQQGPVLEDTQRMRSWLERVEVLNVWSAAPRLLPPNEQAEFLDTAMMLLLNEPDLLGWTEEEERLRLESPYAVDRSCNLLTRPSSETPLQVHEAWRGFERRIRAHPMEARRRIWALIGAIVQLDPGDGPYPGRFSRIQKLLFSALERPALGLEVPDAILHARPEAIAGLLTRPELVSLGMSLLGALSLSRFDTSWEDWESRNMRLETHRMNLWTLALQVLQETLSSASKDIAALALFETIHGLTRELEEPRFGFDPERERLSRKGLEDRLDATLTWLERPPTRAPTQKGRAPSLVEVHGPRLAELFMESARAGDSGWPMAELRILFWLMPRLRVPGAATSAALIDFLASCYRSHLFPEARAEEAPEALAPKGRQAHPGIWRPRGQA
jgi:hypothetical protein